MRMTKGSNGIGDVTNLRQLGSKMEGIRLCCALVVSVFAHAVLLFAALPVADRFEHQVVNAAPFSLDVRIATAPQPVLVQRETLPPRPDQARKFQSPLAEVREADAAPPALEPAMPEEQPVKPLIEAEEAQYDSTVSVADTLYAGPLPRRLEGDWTSGEFLRGKDLDVPPQAIQLGLPEYPEAALDAKATGSILVALLVDEAGRVVGAEAMDAAEEFYEYRDRVAEALRESTFTPGMRDGVAVKAMSFQRVYFALQVARPAASDHATRP
jgi:hypothetical protein